MPYSVICVRCGNQFTPRGLAIHLRMTHGIGTTRQAKRRRALRIEQVLREQRKEIRTVVADYMATAGCGCCGDSKAREAHEAKLATLLRVPMYEDKSGYDFSRYRTQVWSPPPEHHTDE